MNRYLTIFFLTIFCILQAQSQELYVPRDVKQAYKKETRSMDGRPGKNYWQNHGRYAISITANPPSRRIKPLNPCRRSS